MNSSKVLDKLELAIATPSFLDLLGRQMNKERSSQAATTGSPAGTQGTEDFLDSFESVELPDEGDSSSSSSSSDSPCPCSSSGRQPDSNSNADEFTVIGRDDAIEALAHYIAQNISQCPEAQALSPKQLQAALRSTVQGMKRSKFRKMCTLGQYAYRWGAFSYSALQMWQNPWLVQAVSTALYAGTRVALGRII